MRDIRTESGIEIQIIDLIGLYNLTGDACGDGVPDVAIHVFRARLAAGEAALNAPSKFSRLAWWDPDDLPEPLTATARTAIADVADGRSGVVRDVKRHAEPEIPEAVEMA